MLNLNEERMQQIAQAAFEKAEGSKRWQHAIAKAVAQLRDNPVMHFDGEALLILSDSNQIYSANGVCQCKAFEAGQPCWHRTAARLVRRYFEAQ